MVRGAGGGRPASLKGYRTDRPRVQLASAGTLMPRARVMVKGCSWPSKDSPVISCCHVSATR